MTSGANNRGSALSSDADLYDVAVVGTGLVGAAAALTLGRSGSRVALIDQRRPFEAAGRLGFDIRSVALSRSSLDLLDLEIAASAPQPAPSAPPAARPRSSTMEQPSPVAGAPRRRLFHASPIDQMCVWEEHGSGRLTFSANEAGVDALAWMVESSGVCVALWNTCHGLPNVDWIEGIVSQVVSQNTAVTLELKNRSISARLLVAADGAESRVRELAGADLVDRGRGDAAVATVVRAEHPHRGVAYQRFSATGPLAFLPLADPLCCAVIWSAKRDTADELAALDDAAFAEALEVSSERVLGRIAEVDRRFTFPLPQRVVRDFNPAPRILLVGDAAHTLHPLAGQGVNLGLEDVAGIAEEAQRDPTDLGRSGRWRGFALRRRARAEVMIALMRGLRDGYAYGGPVGRWIRNSGVRLIDAAPAIKQQLVREAMGVGVLKKFA